MVVYRQNLAIMLHNSATMKSLLRIRKKKYKFSNLGGILHIKCKTSGWVFATWCWLTEEFDGR